jgi:hypothetical protein
MMTNECPKESSVLAALASGALPDELAAHLNACPDCRDAQLVRSYLNACAASDLATAIPSAELVWWKAQLARKRAAARRSIAWIEAMQKIALAIAAIAAVAIGAWQAPKASAVSPVILAGSAAVLVLFVAGLLVLISLNRGRPLSRDI